MLKSMTFSMIIFLLILGGCSSTPQNIISSEPDFSWAEVDHQCPVVASPDDPEFKNTSTAYSWLVGSEIIDEIEGAHSSGIVGDNVIRLVGGMSQFASVRESEGGAIIILDQTNGGQWLHQNMRQYDNETFGFRFFRALPGSGESMMYFRLLRYELGSTPHFGDDGAVVGKDPIYQYQLQFHWQPFPK